MPDSETLKLIINGGSFALVAVVMLFSLFRGLPAFIKVIKDMGENFRLSIEHLTATHEAEQKATRDEARRDRDSLLAAHQAAVERVASSRDRQTERLEVKIDDIRSRLPGVKSA